MAANPFPVLLLLCLPAVAACLLYGAEGFAESRRPPALWPYLLAVGAAFVVAVLILREI